MPLGVRLPEKLRSHWNAFDHSFWIVITMPTSTPIQVKGVPDDWHAAIEAEAKKMNLPKATVIRSFIQQELKRRGYLLSPPIKRGGFRPRSGSN